jgi:hypothetical protein
MGSAYCTKPNSNPTANTSESPSEPESQISYYRLDAPLFCTAMAEITGNCIRTPALLSEEGGVRSDINREYNVRFVMDDGETGSTRVATR